METASLRRRLERLAVHADDFTRLRAHIHRALRSAVPYDMGALSTLDPATLLWTSCLLVGAHEDPERERRLFALEFEGDDVNRYGDLAAREVPAAGLHIATDGDPTRSRRYRELLVGLGVVDELRVVCRAEGSCWGALTAYRTDDGAPFTTRDVAQMAEASSTVAGLLRLALLHATARASERAGEDRPGLLILAPDGGIAASTVDASVWLDLIDDRDRVPSAVRAVAARARGEDAYASARVPIGGGRWVVVHASPMKQEAAGDEGVISVIIEEARSARMADIVSASFGFTARESEVVALVVRGCANKQIASALGISAYTVQDHLKAIFEKAGVGTRGELAALVQNQFFEPRFAANRTPDAYGWYLDATV